MNPSAPVLAQLGLVLLLAASAASTPAASPVPSRHPYSGAGYYQNLGGSLRLKLREIARVVEQADKGQFVDDPKAGNDVRRITVVAKVLQAPESSADVKKGDVIVIDYTVDYAARAKEMEAAKAAPPEPREFMYEPDPPVADSKGEFWAHLAKAGGRLGNVNRHAGRVVNMQTDAFKGPVFVPIAGQYSFVAPVAKAE